MHQGKAHVLVVWLTLEATGWGGRPGDSCHTPNHDVAPVRSRGRLQSPAALRHELHAADNVIVAVCNNEVPVQVHCQTHGEVEAGLSALAVMEAPVAVPSNR